MKRKPAQVAEWQTRYVEGVVSERTCEFDSHPEHQRLPWRNGRRYDLNTYDSRDECSENKVGVRGATRPTAGSNPAGRFNIRPDGETADTLRSGRSARKGVQVRLLFWAPMRKPNRMQRQRPRPGRNWCLGCDRARVGDGQKCPVCGNLNGPKRFRRRDNKGV